MFGPGVVVILIMAFARRARIRFFTISKGVTLSIQVSFWTLFLFVVEWKVRERQKANMIVLCGWKPYLCAKGEVNRKSTGHWCSPTSLRISGQYIWLSTGRDSDHALGYYYTVQKRKACIIQVVARAERPWLKGYDILHSLSLMTMRVGSSRTKFHCGANVCAALKRRWVASSISLEVNFLWLLKIKTWLSVKKKRNVVVSYVLLDLAFMPWVSLYPVAGYTHKILKHILIFCTIWLVHVVMNFIFTVR